MDGDTSLLLADVDFHNQVYWRDFDDVAFFGTPDVLSDENFPEPSSNTKGHQDPSKWNLLDTDSRRKFLTADSRLSAANIAPVDTQTARELFKHRVSRNLKVELVLTGKAFSILNTDDELQIDDWWSHVRILARMDPN